MMVSADLPRLRRYQYSERQNTPLAKGRECRRCLVRMSLGRDEDRVRIWSLSGVEVKSSLCWEEKNYLVALHLSHLYAMMPPPRLDYGNMHRLSDICITGVLLLINSY